GFLPKRPPVENQPTREAVGAKKDALQSSGGSATAHVSSSARRETGNPQGRQQKSIWSADAPFTLSSLARGRGGGRGGTGTPGEEDARDRQRASPSVMLLLRWCCSFGCLAPGQPPRQDL
ncbi:hypothetical protein HPB47_008302, partial [Ixodes persulcatus]